MPAEEMKRFGSGALLAYLLVFGTIRPAWSQQPPSAQVATQPTGLLSQWEGRKVQRIDFVGVSAGRLAPLPEHLAQSSGTPLNREKLKRSLRQLYATGLYETVTVDGQAQPGGVVLTFRGTPRSFVGTVEVEGAKGASVNSQLTSASQLASGARFTEARLNQAITQMKSALAENGYHQATITPTLVPHPEEQLVDISFHVVSGPQARVGTINVSGDSGMSAEDLRRQAHLNPGKTVDRETGNRALAGVLKHYQKQDRLEAEVKLESQSYSEQGHKTDFRFYANRGPVVKVLVQGASISSERIKHVIPVFEEGAVDYDLLNEGNRNLRDYFQRQGYFDVHVEHEQQPSQADEVTILYKVSLGARRRVLRVSVTGNHYFDSATLQDLLSVHAADSLDRHGAYSQALVSADIAALQAVYQNNGFARVKVTAEADAGEPVGAESQTAAPRKTAPLSIVYHIAEGAQQRVNTVQLEGVEHGDAAKLLPQMNTVAGQLLSPQNLTGDRDSLLTDYLSRGFDQANVEVRQQPDPTDENKVNVVFHVTEGRQIFVRKVLLTGLHYTRPDTVAKAITVHPGDPLNENALVETQRNFYDFALFSEVNTAVENASGEEAYKTVLLQASEARRWALTYGAGFEAQTGTPLNNCSNAIATNTACNPNGKTGISPRLLIDITRNNLFGRDQSASLRGTYGLLEQKVDLLFQNPHFEGNRNFGLTLSGGYANSQDVTTYVASKLEGGIRWTEHFNTPGSFLSKANTLVYEFDFRRVKVAEDSLQVYTSELTALSTAARVAGPGFTWIRDTRDSLLDAHSGTYTSFQDFLSDGSLGAQAEFNRLDLSNSNFLSFGRGRFVLARNTRYGQERSYGSGGDRLLPLPERLYSGGATSHRGFAINAAGPRDPVTGYPVGGAGTLVNSTELRLPPPTLPWVGNAVSVVLFHDMGNVFTNAGDAWASALRVEQPERENCKNTTLPSTTTAWSSTGLKGSCSFNYFSHAPGLGLRYHTPVGPVRFDFSYNLNPPIYPAIQDYTNPSALPHVGQAPHFNFFFSLGQSF